MVWYYPIVFAASCLVLIYSGTLVVQSLSRIAKFLRWKEFTVAFIVMAFASSLPELFVGITSAIHKQPELAFGNIIGSNIINLTLLVALGVFIAKGLKLESTTARRDSLYTALIASLPVLLMLDGELSRIDGGILLLVLVAYFGLIFSQRQRFSQAFANHSRKGWAHFKLFLKALGSFILGLALLLLSAECLVLTTSKMAETIGLPLIVIGTLIVALGTTLPEMMFTIKATLMKEEGLALGNLMGSVVVNTTLVLGVVFLISPLKIPETSIYLAGIIFTILTSIFFYVLSKSRNEISRKEGFVFLVVYFAFVVSQLLLS